MVGRLTPTVLCAAFTTLSRTFLSAALQLPCHTLMNALHHKAIERVQHASAALGSQAAGVPPDQTGRAVVPGESVIQVYAQVPPQIL